MQGDAGQQSVTVTIRTTQQALALAEDWREYALRLEARLELQRMENDKLRIFLKAADTLAE